MGQEWMKGMAALAIGLLAAQAGCTAGTAPSPGPATMTAQGEPALSTPKEKDGAAPAPLRAPATMSAQEKPALSTQEEKQSYGIGVQMARGFKRQGTDVDLDIVTRGMKDAMAGDKLLLTEEELVATMNIFRSEVMRKQAQSRLVSAEDNKKEGEAFLAQNKTKEGVVTLPSGLQYKVLKTGKGPTPTDADTVQCRYRGTLINGTEFDHSDPSGEPAILKVSSVIPGWREALKLMPAGSKWQLFVPSQLAYGTRGTGRDIGPNATLIFELELLAVQ